MDDTNDKLGHGMRATALATFLVGTAIFIAWYFFGSKVLLVGYAYIVVAALVNLSLVSVGLGIALRGKDRKLLLSAVIMLLNIPVMIFYVWLTVEFMDIARITFTNDTGRDLVNLELTGCEEYVIPELAAGESETVWVEIPNDCSVYLKYVLDGKETSGNISGYLTPGLGVALDYSIGGMGASGRYTH